MSFPDDLEWNQPGVEPTQAKKNEGWMPEEKPPAEYFNWFFNRVSQAVQHLKAESDRLNVQYWKAGVAYTLGDIIGSPILANSNKYFECTTAGTSGATEPSWGAVGTTVTDGTVVWSIRDLRDARNADTVGGKQAADFAPSGYGLGEIATSIEGQNLNSIFNTGFYMGSNVTNSPCYGSFATFTVVRTDAGVSTQECSIMLGGYARKWIRHNDHTSGSWSAWRELATIDVVAPAGYGLGENVGATHTITLNSTGTKTGFFYYANTDPNKPDSGDGQILVQSFNNTSLKQTAFSWTGLIYQRQYSSSIWSEWKRIATADNVTNVTVLTGTIADGGTIPLPSGYTQDQCKWMVSVNHIYNSQEASYSDCRADANRIVYVKNTVQPTGGIANYIIIGVK